MIALVVDDSATMRRIEQKALEARGWEVVAAKDGEDALSKLGEIAHCDLILTDWHMPGVDGIELVRKIRGDTRYANIRVIMVTSDTTLDSVELALAAGANDFVMKPFSADALADRVAEVMGV